MTAMQDGLPIADGFAAQRHHMVETHLRSRGLRDERVLAAIDRVPRHAFVPADRHSEAYADHPVIIGEQQTISQPYMVAAMLEAAQIQPDDRVLEVGTGSGYQAAVLAELAAQVFTVERFVSLAQSAEQRLRELGYGNIQVHLGDGTAGLAEAAPFNAIVVAAAAPRAPQPLLDQLAEGGRLVIPIGDREEQLLHVFRKTEHGVEDKRLFGCKFVPLLGKHGFAGTE